MFELERAKAGNQAILVHVEMRKEQLHEDLEEFKELAKAAGVITLEVLINHRSLPDAKYFIGTGKVEEILEVVQAHQADLVLVNHALTPSQERNLEKALSCRVLDRVTLILDIFAQRARSFEGKLQVELAQLKHLSTRLVRGWTHLERQRGGIGLRGPGETQLETDRRLVANRIKQLEIRLEKLQKQREQGRQLRKKNEAFTVALVGYTNAGKSTLFNKLTQSHVYAENLLFATLDPTLRKLELEYGKSVVLADTVGFIRHLPHDLVAAFHSTLQETIEADLLLHVIDASSTLKQEQIEQVNAVLEEIQAEKIPQILVYNKIDKLNEVPKVIKNETGYTVWLSALQEQGLDLLKKTIREFFFPDMLHAFLYLPVDAGRIRAHLFSQQAILKETIQEDGTWILEIFLPESNFIHLQSKEKDLKKYKLVIN